MIKRGRSGTLFRAGTHKLAQLVMERPSASPLHSKSVGRPGMGTVQEIAPVMESWQARSSDGRRSESATVSPHCKAGVQLGTLRDPHDLNPPSHKGSNVRNQNPGTSPCQEFGSSPLWTIGRLPARSRTGTWALLGARSACSTAVRSAAAGDWSAPSTRPQISTPASHPTIAQEANCQSLFLGEISNFHPNRGSGVDRFSKENVKNSTSLGSGAKTWWVHWQEN